MRNLWRRWWNWNPSGRARLAHLAFALFMLTMEWVVWENVVFGVIWILVTIAQGLSYWAWRRHLRRRAEAKAQATYAFLAHLHRSGMNN